MLRLGDIIINPFSNRRRGRGSDRAQGSLMVVGIRKGVE